MTEEIKNEKKIIDYLLDEYYEKRVAATRLHDMFPHDLEAVWDYIQEGRQFWDYDDKERIYKLITITYKRSGVAFYTVEGSDDEHYFCHGSIHADLLYPRVVHVQDIINNAKKKYNTKHKYEVKEQDIIDLYTKMKLHIPADYVQIDVEF